MPYPSVLSPMDAVTISPKFQIVIPKVMRERMHLKPGMKLVTFDRGDQLILIPVTPIKAFRGIVPRMDLSDLREHGDPHERLFPYLSAKHKRS